MSNRLSADGHDFVRGLLSPPEVNALREAVGDAPGAGRRGMLAHAGVATLARSPRLLEIVGPHLAAPFLPSQYAPATPRPVRAILFDKSSESNWLVGWHQDLTIAVGERLDVPGFGPWSAKDGVPHVQPPVELLEHMVTVRLHLDDANESNGALRVLAGTHRHGRLEGRQIEELRQSVQETVCLAACGDALIMRPLLLHASSRATTPSRRRVLHIEYAACALPAGLTWRPGS